MTIEMRLIGIMGWGEHIIGSVGRETIASTLLRREGDLVARLDVKGHGPALAVLEAEFAGLEAVGQLESAAVAAAGVDAELGHLGIGPFGGDFEVTPGDEPVEVAAAPGFGEGGQDLDHALVALEEHFGHPGDDAEAGVDLKGRANRPEVGQRFFVR